MKMLCAEHELSDYEKGEQTAGRLAAACLLCEPELGEFAEWLWKQAFSMRVFRTPSAAAGLLSGWRLIEPDEQLMSS